MAPVREFVPAIVRSYSRSDVERGVARLPWPNVAAGAVLKLDDVGLVRVVAVVAPSTSSPVDAFAKVGLLRE